MIRLRIVSAFIVSLALGACSTLPGWMVLQGKSAITDYQHFDNAPIARAASAAPLPVSGSPIAWGESLAAHDAWQASQGTVALIVLRSGEVVFERYYSGHQRESLLTSFSVAKSVVSALVGIALHEGRLASIDEPITTYIPELRRNDPRYSKISLRHLLHMRSGIDFDEGYLSPVSDAAKLYLTRDIAAQIAQLRIQREPNQAFQYSSGDTQLLAMALERAVGEPLASYMQRKLWEPMGSQFDASWSLDSRDRGQAKGFCCLNARALDFARFGQLFLQKGQVRGVSVVPSDWVRDSTSPAQNLPGESRASNRNIERPGLERQAYYGMQWRVAPLPPAANESTYTQREPSKHFYAQGLHGQFIYVAPNEQTVIVRLGSKEGTVFWPAWLGQLARQSR